MNKPSVRYMHSYIFDQTFIDNSAIKLVVYERGQCTLHWANRSLYTIFFTNIANSIDTYW